MPNTCYCLRGEAAIDEFMADPIVQLVMHSDQVSAEELRALLRAASERLTRAPERATDAAEHLPPQGLAPGLRLQLHALACPEETLTYHRKITLAWSGCLAAGH